MCSSDLAIGKDQKEVLKAKSKFAALDPQNAASYWGDSQKLLPNIADRSIDNFLLILSQYFDPLNTIEEKLSARSVFAVLALKLVKSGTLQILTDLEEDSVEYKELINMVLETGFERDQIKPTRVYFKIDRKYPEFTQGKIPRVLIFRPKRTTVVEK